MKILSSILPSLLLCTWIAAQETSDSSSFVPLELPTKKVTSASNRPQNQLEEGKLRLPASIDDPLKVLASQPGVSAQNDLNSRPFIRGGKSEETKVVLNGIPLQQAYHVGGVFSLMNIETLEHLRLHTHRFPVEYSDALSGVVEIKTRKPSLDTFQLAANLSMLRGLLVVESPIVKNKMGVSFASQSFIFNQSINGMMDVMASLSDNPNFKSDIEGYKEHVNLPFFQDFQLGGYYQASDNIELKYTGILGLDRYQVLIPRSQNIITKPNSDSTPIIVIPPIDNPPLIPEEEINRSNKLQVDSISAVDIQNQIHILNIPWSLSNKKFINTALAFQSQVWDVHFKDEIQIQKPLALSLDQKAYEARSDFHWKWNSKNTLHTGGGVKTTVESYTTDLPFALYDVLVNSNLDMLDGLGFFAGEPFDIERIDTTKETFDYLSELPLRLQFSHSGTHTSHQVHSFISNQYNISQHWKWHTGVRIQYESLSNEIWPLPFFEISFSPNSRNTISLSTGVYAQPDLPFYMRAQNPQLLSEKSLQFNTGWHHVFRPEYRFTLSPYYKYYFDLVSADLIPTQNLDLDGLLVPIPNSGLNPSEIDTLRQQVENANSIADLSPEQQAQAFRVFGDQEFSYANAGIGHALGLEVLFDYTPQLWWEGRLGTSLSQSLRRDFSDQEFYEYRYHRPWSLKWLNSFSISHGFELSFNYHLSGGHPYTPYSGILSEDKINSTEPVHVGAKNSGRLAPYSRTDFRLSKKRKFFKKDLQTYLEVWNTWNRPNYFSRDAGTGEIKSVELNWPFPFLFFGLRLEI